MNGNRNATDTKHNFRSMIPVLHLHDQISMTFLLWINMSSPNRHMKTSQIQS